MMNLPAYRQGVFMTHPRSSLLPPRPGAALGRSPVVCVCQSERPQPREGRATPRKTPLLPSRRTLVTAAPGLCCCACCSGPAAAAAAVAGRNAFLDGVFAEAMFTGMDEYEAEILPVKTRLFGELNEHLAAAGTPAHVVELGAGTGPNLSYCDSANVALTAVDPNDAMLPFLKQNMEKAGWREESVTWVPGVAEALPLEDSSADAVVCTLVLCSVGDVAAAVREARRVLRPGGKFLYIEHTLARRDRALLRVGQTLLNPLQRFCGDGCNLTRDPLPAIEGAGFAHVDALRFEVEGMGLIAPHVAGIATN